MHNCEEKVHFAGGKKGDVRACESCGFGQFKDSIVRVLWDGIQEQIDR